MWCLSQRTCAVYGRVFAVRFHSSPKAVDTYKAHTVLASPPQKHQHSCEFFSTHPRVTPHRHQYVTSSLLRLEISVCGMRIDSPAASPCDSVQLVLSIYGRRLFFKTIQESAAGVLAPGIFVQKGVALCQLRRRESISKMLQSSS